MPPRSKQLVYERYRVRFPEAEFHYRACGRSYVNRVFLDCWGEEDFTRADPKILDAILNSIGMMFVPHFFALADFASVRADALPMDGDSYPFLSSDQIGRVFGEDLFAGEEIRAHIMELVGESVRPFECVGTREECRVVLSLALRKAPTMDAEWPRRPDLARYCVGLDLETAWAVFIEGFHKPHYIPDELLGPLQGAVAELSSPDAAKRRHAGSGRPRLFVYRAPHSYPNGETRAIGRKVARAIPLAGRLLEKSTRNPGRRAYAADSCARAGGENGRLPRGRDLGLVCSAGASESSGLVNT